jgi:hypothetical protein
MGIDNNNSTNEEATEEGGEQEIDFWSDEGARRFNEMLDEGSAYASANPRLSEDFEAHCDDEQREYLDPDLYDPDEETLPPGEMEIIFENSYIM